MAKKTKPPKDSSKSWAMLSAVSGIAAATVARKVLDKGWKAATGKEPPANPADPDVAIREAILWASVSGTIVALARMAAGRKAAGYFVKSTGHLPPELESDDVRSARLAAHQARTAGEASASDAKASRKKKRKS